MSKTGHKLTKLSGCVMPEHIIFVDTETTQTMHSNGRLYHDLMLGVAIYGRFRRDGKKNIKHTYRFNSNLQFWQYVADRCLSKTVLYLISHNAVFDFTIVKHIKHLSALGYKVQFVYEGGVTFISKWRKKGHSIVILDNANWFKGKLAKWGKELDLPKLEMPKGVSSEDKWFTYCERDTEILYQLYVWYSAFLCDNNLGNWRYTIASSAFTSFRHRFMSHNIYIPNPEAETDIARTSYHGGRTECFKVGIFDKDTYYKLDINSMYPYIMRNYEYPVCFETRHSNPDKGKVILATRTKAIIADCLVKVSLPYFIYRQNNRNVYPVGEFRTILTTEEYILAHNNGWVKEIYDVCIYRKRNIFAEYVDFFYSIKTRASRENKLLVRAFSKLYLNSLYGKFGQKGYVDRVIGQDATNTLRVSYGYNVRTGQRYVLRQLGHQVIYTAREGEGYNSFCAIASHVTATSRLLLYDTILRAGRENCYYCDTDSLIVNTEGFNRLKSLLDSVKLGYWKIEDVSDSLEIVAPKHYRFGAKIVMKGVRKDAKKLGPDTYRQEIWPGLNTILKQGKEEYFNIFQTKTLSPCIQSGMVQSDGTVIPFVIS